MSKINRRTLARPTFRTFAAAAILSALVGGFGGPASAQDTDGAPQPIAGFVWDDTDDNGRYDLEELPISGVELRLHKDNDQATVVDRVVTDDDGFYRFAAQSAGIYVVAVSADLWQDDGVLAGFRSSTGHDADSKSDNGIDSENAEADVFSDEVVVDDLGADRSVDLGFHAPVHQLDARVWDDTDGNGVFDEGEESIGGVWIELHVDADLDGFPDDLDGDGVIASPDLVASDTTADDGSYVLDDLDPGSYVVSISPVMFETGGHLAAYGTDTTDRIHSTTITLDRWGSTDDDGHPAIGFGLAQRDLAAPQTAASSTTIDPAEAPPIMLPRVDLDAVDAKRTTLARPVQPIQPAEAGDLASAPLAVAGGATPFLILIAVGLMGLTAAAVLARRQYATKPIEQETPLDGPYR